MPGRLEGRAERAPRAGSLRSPRYDSGMKKLAIALTFVVPALAFAQQSYDSRGMPQGPGYTPPKADRGSNGPMEAGQTFRGEVKAIDKVSGTVTLKHGPIMALGIPAATSEYGLQDATMLDRLKIGQEVRFNAVMQGRSILVTKISPAN